MTVLDEKGVNGKRVDCRGDRECVKEKGVAMKRVCGGVRAMTYLRSPLAMEGRLIAVMVLLSISTQPHRELSG